jgi:hypothetical protein
LVNNIITTFYILGFEPHLPDKLEMIPGDYSLCGLGVQYLVVVLLSSQFYCFL